MFNHYSIYNLRYFSEDRRKQYDQAKYSIGINFFNQEEQLFMVGLEVEIGDGKQTYKTLYVGDLKETYDFIMNEVNNGILKDYYAPLKNSEKTFKYQFFSGLEKIDHNKVMYIGAWNSKGEPTNPARGLVIQWV